MSRTLLYQMVENAMEAEKDLKPASYVYVARAWSSGCEYQIKVGRSIDPDKRIETLQKDISGRSRNPHKFPEEFTTLNSSQCGQAERKPKDY